MYLFLASVALLAQAAQPVVPISDIFVRDPQPEWSAPHERHPGFWEGHASYHAVMDSEVGAFEAAWTMRPKDAAYDAAKRALLRRLQLQHRALHANLNPKAESARPVRVERPVVKKSTSRIVPLPKRSRRLLLRDYYDQLEYRNY